MDPPSPTKIFAVHLNYASRAHQRGRIPSEPSYFLKPPSSLTGDGELRRPRGAELLAYEGEIAVIIGRTAKDVAPEDALSYIGWYAAANDAGAHDFRSADRGSNLLAKGRDGYTPMSRPVPAADVDPAALRLRTLVNGKIVQDDIAEHLLFGFARLIADLSRAFTLDVGDIILTGTPAGTSVLSPGDVVEVELVGHARVRSVVVEDPEPLAPYGAMPRARPADRAYALGINAPRPVTLSDDARAVLARVSTATLTTQLARHGITAVFLSGLTPSRPALRMVGYARTLRYGAARADVREQMRGAGDAQKQAVETLSPEDVLIMEARGEPGAGTIGDILVARALARGAAGVVTDGGVRDTPGIAEIDLPVYWRTPNAESLWLRHVPLAVDEPITCAGVLVMPGDVIVGDAEGAIVIPATLAEQVAIDSAEQEEREAFALERMHDGEALAGLYPLGDERRAEYENWLRKRQRGE